jgi:peptidylglycine monooxygenase
MAAPPLYVSLGETRYRIDRPWGDFPAGPGRVCDVACDERGHIFALLRSDPYTNPSAPAIVEFAASGERQAAWGGDIVADSHMLTAGPDQTLYVVDRDAHEVVIFDRWGKRIGGLGTRHYPGEPFRHPTDVAIAPNGDIYVADGYGASQVHRFDASGGWVGAWGVPGAGPGQFTTPHSLVILPDRRVAVADRENNRVQIFTPDGDYIDSWTDLYKPVALFADGAGKVYVTDEVPRLTMLSAEGVMLGRCRPTWNIAHGLSGDAEGNLYLAEGNPSRVTRLTPV